MRLLAVDTSTEHCSAALLWLRDRRRRCVARSTERGHAELILPMIDELLSDAGWTLARSRRARLRSRSRRFHRAATRGRRHPGSRVSRSGLRVAAGVQSCGRRVSATVAGARRTAGARLQRRAHGRGLLGLLHGATRDPRRCRSSAERVVPPAAMRRARWPGATRRGQRHSPRTRTCAARSSRAGLQIHDRPLSARRCGCALGAASVARREMSLRPRTWCRSMCATSRQARPAALRHGNVIIARL